MKRPRKAQAVEIRISKWKAAADITPDSALAFMQDVRKCLEAINEKKRYPFLSTYCDWLLHGELTRVQHSLILKQISSVMLAEAGTLYTNRVSGFTLVKAGLGVGQVFSELVDLLSGLSISSALFADADICSRFAVCLLVSVTHQPIEPIDRQKARTNDHEDIFDGGPEFGPILIQGAEILRCLGPVQGSATVFQLCLTYKQMNSGREHGVVYNLFDASAFGLDLNDLPPIDENRAPVLTF